MNHLPSQSSPAVAAAPGASRPLRLLQVLGYAGVSGRKFGITGVERVVQLLVEALPSGRYRHFVAYPRVGELHSDYERHATVLDLEPRRWWDRTYVAALAGATHTHGIDLVVSHGLRFDFLAEQACRRMGVPHLVVRAVALADEPMPGWKKRLFMAADSWTLGKCQRIVAVSEASKRRMVATQHLPDEKLTVIPNGVRLPAIAPEARRAARHALGVGGDTPLVGGMGQLIPRKAFHLLVEAVGRLREEHPQVQCVVIGEGPERERLAGLARSLGVTLHLPGYLKDPYPTLAGLEVAVLPSRAEGMPLVVLEAMALGVACVATPAAGTAEVIEDGRSGLLFPVDDVPALAAALTALLGDPGRRDAIAEAGAERARSHFGLEAMLARFDTTFHAAAGRSASP